MRAVDQWALIEQKLPAGWEEAQISLVVEDSGSAPSAAAVLAPLSPGRTGDELRFNVRGSGTAGVQTVKNLLRRLDQKRIWATLTLVDARTKPPPEAAPQPLSLVDAWDAALRELPPGWSDLLCELEIDSSDYLPRAALLGAPLNPTRNLDGIALRFRVSGKQGYGAPPEMARRCLERMDAEGIAGSVTVLSVLSDTENVATQGPVWRIAGRSV